MCRVYRKPSSRLDLFATDLFLERAKKGAGKLLRLNELFPFESYRSFITQAIDTYRISHGGKPTSQLSSAGRRAMDPIFMLKCVVAQRLYGKADRDFEGDAAKPSASALAWYFPTRRCSQSQDNLEIQGNFCAN